MRSYEQLEEAWQKLPPAPRESGTVTMIVVRPGHGERECPGAAAVTVAEGLVGDRWNASNDPERTAQITLMEKRVADLVSGEWCGPEMAGDNFVVDFDLSEDAVPIGTRIAIGSAVLEVTDEPHTGCRQFRERYGAGALRWVNLKDHRDRKLRGINCRVVKDGQVSVGDRVAIVS